MRRIYLPFEKNAGSIRITGEKAHYLSAVLRCREGDEVHVFDGKGLSYKARITKLTKKDVVVDLNDIAECDTESPANLILIQGVLKAERMDFVIQKTSELGITEIIPAVTERTQVRETKKLSRWRKIAEEASRQCCRAVVPVIHPPMLFTDIFSFGSSYEDRFKKSACILFWEEGGKSLTEIHEMIKDHNSLFFAIGPEGGFSAGEVHLSKSKGFVVASLGSRMLRAETAAISATTLLQFMTGGLG